MSKRRVVVTGLGLVSPVGNNVDEAWASVRASRSGLGPITLFDASSFDVQVAAEVKGFDITAYGIESRAVRKMARFTQFLLGASAQAISDAGYDEERMSHEGQRLGICVGNCFGGMDVQEESFKRYFDPAIGPSRIPPLTAPLMIMNEAAANVSIFYGLQGPAWTIATACASGSDALGQAAQAIRSGMLDVCISGGTESNICGFGMATFSALLALSTHYNDTPQTASRPFDRTRDGFVFGEGAAVLVLEELEHAKKRGATIYAELAGYGSSSDAHHITAPLKDGSGAALALRKALSDAEVSPQDVQYYNAHGTSTQANDASESRMLKSVFGEHAYSLKVSSTKSMTGHMVGAAGAIEALFCVKAIQDGFFPPTINLNEPDIESGCDLDYVPNVGVEGRIEVAASASLGFGGHNAVLVVKRFKE